MDERAIRIGVLGDFNPAFRSHRATNAAIQHAAAAASVRAETRWVPTPSLLEPEAEATIAGFDGLWASAGSPYKSFDGMLRGIELARTRNWPFVGT